jgi:hypothetical protein
VSPAHGKCPNFRGNGWPVAASKKRQDGIAKCGKSYSTATPAAALLGLLGRLMLNAPALTELAESRVFEALRD